MWTNDDRNVRELIKEPGHGLAGVPGFKTTCFCIHSPNALFYMAQTRQNVVAVSTNDGSYLWHRQKDTNDPSMLYVDGHLLIGIGPVEGNVLKLDLLSGRTRHPATSTKSCERAYRLRVY